MQKRPERDDDDERRGFVAVAASLLIGRRFGEKDEAASGADGHTTRNGA